MRAKRDNGDEGIAQMLEAAADEINAKEVQIDWEALGGLVSQVKKGALAADEALARAAKLVPHDRQYVLTDLRDELAAVAARGTR